MIVGRVQEMSRKRKKKKFASELYINRPHREASALANELQEESDQFRFLRAACYANIKGISGVDSS